MNPLYLGITHANGYIEEMGVNKYLIFDSMDENNELLKKYNDVFNGIIDKIKEVNNDECDYEKDYMKIKYNSDDNFWYMSKDDTINIMNGSILLDKRDVL